MKDLQLKSHRFRTEREADWRRLEGLLGRVERGSAKSLSDEELLAIPVLYRSALSSLSVARATSLDHALVDYLEGLSTRAYFFVYGARAGLRQRLSRFFVETWPAAVRGLWRETLAAALIFAVATALGFWLVWNDPGWFTGLVGGMSEGRDPTASTAALRATLYHPAPKGDELSMLAGGLFTHNAQIALMAFALGFAFGAPTVFLLAQNALTLGGFLALFASRGLGFQFAGWILIHGVTEIFAILLAGAAGFRIGWRVAFPGDRSRLDAAADAGRSTAPVVAGVVLMLVVAGLLEGFGRQLIQDDWARYSIAGATLAIWLGYFYLPRRRRPI